MQLDGNIKANEHRYKYLFYYMKVVFVFFIKFLTQKYEGVIVVVIDVAIGFSISKRWIQYKDLIPLIQ